MKIAIITARGGSKRIPRKNIRPFLGKPMLAWPIEAAQASGCFDHIFVSTDDDEIAAVAKEYGATVPFMRPKNLADDFTHAHKAARHCLEWAIEQIGSVTAFCHLYPTSPFLTPANIQEGYADIKNGATNAYAMVRVPFPVYQMLVRTPSDRLEALFSEELANMRSQDMPETFIGAGQMYWFETQYFLAHETKIGPKTKAVVLSHAAAIDIDTEEDWLWAEQMAQLKQSK